MLSDVPFRAAVGAGGLVGAQNQFTVYTVGADMLLPGHVEVSSDIFGQIDAAVFIYRENSERQGCNLLSV